jgi:hypothetical protein
MLALTAAAVEAEGMFDEFLESLMPEDSESVGNDDPYSLVPSDPLGIEADRDIDNKENYFYGLQSIKIVATGES